MTWRTVSLLAAALAAAGCDASWRAPPAVQPGAEPVALDRSAVTPMFRELTAIDLPTVVQVVQARNLDILAARQRVEASHGQYAGRVGAAFPILSPGLVFAAHGGGAQDSTGDIVSANFRSLHPAAAVLWTVNPGQVIYDIIASKKRLEASQEDELSVRIRTLGQAAVQYYDLCLAQADIATAVEAQREAEELLRTTRLKRQTGNAVPADEWRAQAALAGRQEDLLTAVNRFYHASVAMATTLELDSSVTLVPRPERLGRITLVREDLTLDKLMEMAIRNRPDLKSAWARVAAAEADKGSVAWGGFGPGVTGGYEVGGFESRANGRTFPMRGDQWAAAGAGWQLSLATIGNLETADARHGLAGLEAQMQLDQLRAEVVQAMQDGRTNAELIPLADDHVKAAQEALRRVQEDYRTGTAILLDVLDAQTSLAQARFRYAQAVVRSNQSQVRILAALGLLDPESLRAGEPTKPNA